MDAHKARMRQSSVECDWRTPPELAERLHRAVPFTLDLAANEESMVVGAHGYLGPGSAFGEDSLQTDWHNLGQIGFLNPPYSVSEISRMRAEGLPPAAWRHLQIENWALKAYAESLAGFTTVAVMPYAPQTKWFRRYVMGHLEREEVPGFPRTIWEHAALDLWRLPHRISFLRPDGSKATGANVNSCIVIWGPNPGFVGPWVPSGRYWTYR